jgi:hypothetical protein
MREARTRAANAAAIFDINWRLEKKESAIADKLKRQGAASSLV